jgi:hypothetical protein
MAGRILCRVRRTPAATPRIDISKNVGHVVGLDRRGAIALRVPWSGGGVEAQLATYSCRPERMTISSVERGAAGDEDGRRGNVYLVRLPIQLAR